MAFDPNRYGQPSQADIDAAAIDRQMEIDSTAIDRQREIDSRATSQSPGYSRPEEDDVEYAPSPGPGTRSKNAETSGYNTLPPDPTWTRYMEDDSPGSDIANRAQADLEHFAQSPDPNAFAAAQARRSDVGAFLGIANSVTGASREDLNMFSDAYDNMAGRFGQNSSMQFSGSDKGRLYKAYREAVDNGYDGTAQDFVNQHESTLRLIHAQILAPYRDAKGNVSDLDRAKGDALANSVARNMYGVLAESGLQANNPDVVAALLPKLVDSTGKVRELQSYGLLGQGQDSAKAIIRHALNASDLTIGQTNPFQQAEKDLEDIKAAMPIDEFKGVLNGVTGGYVGPLRTVTEGIQKELGKFYTDWKGTPDGANGSLSDLRRELNGNLELSDRIEARIREHIGSINGDPDFVEGATGLIMEQLKNPDAYDRSPMDGNDRLSLLSRLIDVASSQLPDDPAAPTSEPGSAQYVAETIGKAIHDAQVKPENLANYSEDEPQTLVEKLTGIVKRKPIEIKNQNGVPEGAARAVPDNVLDEINRYNGELTKMQVAKLNGLDVAKISAGVPEGMRGMFESLLSRYINSYKATGGSDAFIAAAAGESATGLSKLISSATDPRQKAYLSLVGHLINAPTVKVETNPYVIAAYPALVIGFTEKDLAMDAMAFANRLPISRSERGAIVEAVRNSGSKNEAIASIIRLAEQNGTTLVGVSPDGKFDPMAFLGGYLGQSLATTNTATTNTVTTNPATTDATTTDATTTDDGPAYSPAFVKAARTFLQSIQGQAVNQPYLDEKKRQLSAQGFSQAQVDAEALVMQQKLDAAGKAGGVGAARQLAQSMLNTRRWYTHVDLTNGTELPDGKNQRLFVGTEEEARQMYEQYMKTAAPIAKKYDEIAAHNKKVDDEMYAAMEKHLQDPKKAGRPFNVKPYEDRKKNLPPSRPTLFSFEDFLSWQINAEHGAEEYEKALPGLVEAQRKRQLDLRKAMLEEEKAQREKIEHAITVRNGNANFVLKQQKIRKNDREEKAAAEGEGE